jgi:hypothetical protein
MAQFREKNMAKCSKCGKPLSAGEKFCGSCGTPVNPPATKKTAAAAGGGGMGIVAVIVVIAACAVIGASFFLPFFAVSFAGFGESVNGIEAAVSGGSGTTRTGDANPALLLALVLPAALLAALFVPPIRKKQGPFRFPVVGGMAIVAAIVGLIVLYSAYSPSIENLKSEFEEYQAYLALWGVTDPIEVGTGIGFKMAFIAYIVLLVVPIADRCVRRRK